MGSFTGTLLGDHRMDPQSRELLDQINQAPAMDFRTTPLQDLRTHFKPPALVQDSGIEKIETISIPNSQVKVRVYTPKHETPLPIFVFIHGGGWILGNLDQYDSMCQTIALESHSIVISVDYRLAPESPFPGPIEDCYLAANWVQENAQRLGGIADKIAIGGDSAGANLAAAVTLMAKDRNRFQFAAQVLICPVLNHNFETLSYFEFERDHLVSKDDLMFCWELYLKDEKNGENPYASPLKAKSLKDLPPAYLLIANFDPLRDEGLAYASRLQNEGVPVTLRRFDSIHGFYHFDLTVAKEAIQFIASQLNSAFFLPKN
ncbi:MAG TPA: alpha/beta hydrolase [Rhabdochlamydiaceae bacterium]|nr:alpha/beta hydrolase [Rhabdochlamydiaceae bacterium]